MRAGMLSIVSAIFLRNTDDNFFSSENTKVRYYNTNEEVIAGSGQRAILAVSQLAIRPSIMW
jgi:hypothetical protein